MTPFLAISGYLLAGLLTGMAAYWFDLKNHPRDVGLIPFVVLVWPVVAAIGVLLGLAWLTVWVCTLGRMDRS